MNFDMYTNEQLFQKEMQHWAMAVSAKRDSDTEDEKRHVDLARAYRAELSRRYREGDCK